MIHVQPTSFTVRCYAEGFDFPQKFCAVYTVQQIGQHSIFVSAMCGKITRQHLRDGAAYFKKQGIKFVLAQRHGVIKQHKIEEYL